MAKWKTQIYYSTFIEETIEAETAEEAIKELRFQLEDGLDDVDMDNMIANLSPWRDADSAEELFIKPPSKEALEQLGDRFPLFTPALYNACVRARKQCLKDLDFLR